jgi:prevent-host-death family protein
MAPMPTIIPISELRQDAAGIIKRAAATDEPVFITQRGRAAAVVVSARRYERTQHEFDVLRALARGEAEIEAGTGYDLADVLAEADDLLGGLEG